VDREDRRFSTGSALEAVRQHKPAACTTAQPGPSDGALAILYPIPGVFWMTSGPPSLRLRRPIVTRTPLVNGSTFFCRIVIGAKGKSGDTLGGRACGGQHGRQFAGPAYVARA
jgi:hypothetical protein